jgi:hypothetical protein
VTIFHVLKYFEQPIKTSALPQPVRDSWIDRIRLYTDELVSKAYPVGELTQRYEQQKNNKRDCMESLQFYLQWIVDACEMIDWKNLEISIHEADARRIVHNQEECKRFLETLREELLNYEGPT